MQRIPNLPVHEVVLAVAACACTGTTRYETERDSGLPDAPWEAEGAAGSHSDAAPPADASSDALPAGCEDVGKGPGVEICCNGELCHGTWCDPPDKYHDDFRCWCGEGAPNCPPTAACCKIISGNGAYYCVAPGNCLPSQ